MKFTLGDRDMTFSNLLKGTAAAVLSVGLSVSAADARTFDLAFLMDSSGSIGAGNFSAAMGSLAAALTTHITADILAQDTYNITVVTFSDGASVVTSQAVTNLTELASVTSAITGASYTQGYTDFEAAFDALLGHATALTAGANASIINMMTDGNPCLARNCPMDAAGLADVASARDDLITAGWDSLSFEAVTGNADSSYLAGLGFDAGGIGGLLETGNPNDIAGLNIVNDAFVLSVDSFGQDFDTAIDIKVQAVVSPVPIPATLPLMAGGFALLGFAARRRKA